MGNLALMLCAEDPLAKFIPGYLPESERVEAFLWANLCCLAEKVDSPEEKQKILNSSNGALQSMRFFTVGKAYALTGLVTDSEGLNTPFVVFRETPDDSVANATKLLLIDFKPLDFVTSKGTVVGQAIDDYITQYYALRDIGLVRWAIQSARLSTKGLTIAGHGVGAALANLLAVELLVDYGNEFRLRLRTFGAPRVFTMPTSASIEILSAYNKMSFTRYINDGDCFPSLPPRMHGLGHIGTAAKFDSDNKKWWLGKYADITVETNHTMVPHFFQGEKGYINNLRCTIVDEIKDTAMDFDAELSELEKSKKDLRLSASLTGSVLCMSYAKKRDGQYVDQENGAIIHE